MHKTDILIVGGGVAGLTVALNIAPEYKVTILAKAPKEGSNSWFAQGGVAAVITNDPEDIKKHIEDTLVAGDGLCNEKIVKIVVEEGPKRIQELIKLGAEFDKTEKGEYSLGKEGGHSKPRILHYKDQTGKLIIETLWNAVKERPNITILDHYVVIELITQHHLGIFVDKHFPGIECYGVYAYNKHNNKVEKFLSKITVLATGGVGNVYSVTTNPPGATGDGIAMAFRAKARIANMEFIQFHPTALYDPDEKPAFLITEALRGKGAILRSYQTKARFMPNYHPMAELAPRDIVARAIDTEMKKDGSDYVYLDATHLDPQMLKKEFPTIYKKCLEKGIDITKDLIPVSPAAHYVCGGIDVNEYSQTSINNLFAVGECAHTGLHGANRLASNSLLEALVFGYRAAKKINETLQNKKIIHNEKIPEWDDKGTQFPEEWILISHNAKEIKKIMTDYVGIVRSQARLKRAERRIRFIMEETEEFYKKTTISSELCELRNIITNAFLISYSARKRKESRGLHFRTDFPEKMEYIYNTYL